jgi:Fic family protein
MHRRSLPAVKLEKFKSGVWRQQLKYKSFQPVPINQPWTWEDPVINTLLEDATRALGELNAFSLIVPNVDLFIQMHVAKEAQASSRIEGTNTRMEEVVLPEEQIRPERRDDWREVNNYRDGMNGAIEALGKLPLSNRLLRSTHETLMQGVRGEHKLPGEFRNSQNWIGGSSLADAAFVPPHHSEVPELMKDLEAFWHNDSIAVPHLIRAALSHYQFETIHPFLDGNGRVGRLLIPLYFISKGLLAKPSLYLSDFFERHRGSYYDSLTAVRQSNDIIQWVRFFLTGVAETSNKGRDTFQNILALRTITESQILSLGKRAPNARKALDLLYRKSATSANMLSKSLGVSKPVAHALIRDFERLGILREITGFERNRVFVFASYLELF